MKYKLPEALDGLTVVELQAEIDKALDARNDLGKITEDSSDEEIDAALELKGAINTLVAAKTAAEEKAAERAAKVADAADVPEVPKAETPEPAKDETPADTPAETPEPAKDETPAEPAVETPAEPVVAEQTPEPVAASGGAVARAAASAPPVSVPDAERPAASLIAAADVPGLAAGAELDGMAGVTAAIMSRANALPKRNLATANGGVHQRFGAAIIEKPSNPELVQSREGGSDLSLVWQATDAARLPGGSLAAAGGWCSPSETAWDLCQYETVEGILDVPDITISRGGLRWTQGPSFDDIYAACGFFQTEAEAIAGDTKDCCTVDCPEFDEIRLDAIGLCIKSPILTEHAYPELTQRFVEGALVAHQHKVNAYVLDAIALSAGTSSVAADAGAFRFTLLALEFAAIGMRYSYRLSQTAALEVILPFWAKTVLRMDLAMINGRDNMNVDDAELNAWFTSRNLSIQWVYDLDDPTIDRCDVTLPTDVTAYLYPAGTWAKGGTNVVNMDAVYDSPNLEVNVYTALFVEESILAVQKCLHTCAIELPITVSGQGVLETLDLALTAPSGGGEPTAT